MSRDAIFGDINRKVLQFFELRDVVSRHDAPFASLYALVAAFACSKRSVVCRPRRAC
ncbi:hypothetical protein PLANPX_4317 [Lacipirellula parvula]|uniref:Uncharacterized protein n=1 Tax=Lacipirellula parvula TaxID=2650471 RepID=A0A5K7XE88_9BACT|nr:hypothetical protein PLANPX_4317 [Lacipirellula parvula]